MQILLVYKYNETVKQKQQNGKKEKQNQQFPGKSVLL